jgi:hypothetical protein
VLSEITNVTSFVCDALMSDISSSSWILFPVEVQYLEITFWIKTGVLLCWTAR